MPSSSLRTHPIPRAAVGLGAGHEDAGGLADLDPRQVGHGHGGGDLHVRRVDDAQHGVAGRSHASLGEGMAARLLSSGFPLAVYNRNKDKAAALASAGATVAKSPREAASGAEFIISMVADDVASRGVWLGDNGALAGASRDAADQAPAAHRTALCVHAEEEEAHVEVWDRFASSAGWTGPRAPHPESARCASAWRAGETLLEHLAVLYVVDASGPLSARPAQGSSSTTATRRTRRRLSTSASTPSSTSSTPARRGS